MARRAFLPTIPPPGGPTSTPRVSVPPPPGSTGILPDSRRSVPPPLPGVEGISIAAAAQLIDRLASSDDATFLASWIESVMASRGRTDPALAVRLLRAYRELGRIDRARELALTLPSSPSSWGPLDVARLAIERAYLATFDGRADHADSEFRQAARALSLAPKGTGQREQLDVHLATTQLELKMGRTPQAMSAFRLAEHVVERLDDGALRVAAEMTLGHLAMRLAEPRCAAKHYTAALARTATRSMGSLTAHANIAIALGSTGRLDEARQHAESALDIAREVAPGWRHADAFDVLAVVEIASDRPAEALAAVDEALVILGDAEQQLVRLQIAAHKALALAMMGRDAAAEQWLQRAEQIRAELTQIDPVDDQDLVCVRARTLESAGKYTEALMAAMPYTARLGETFITGTLNLVVARCSLGLGDEQGARAAAERAALSGDRRGWVFPDREVSAKVWALALRSGDSRVVRYAEQVVAMTNSPSTASLSIPPMSNRTPSRLSFPSLPSMLDADATGEQRASSGAIEGESLIYVTTLQGVVRVPRAELAKHLEGISLVVDTMTHALRVDSREISLERRRALEPLVVQLLRRAREGLSAEEILRAAGGPGPESADAEHRVRVLISRVRDLLGDPTAIERVRDAGEYGRTRYRLAVNVKFALVEPLFSSASE